MNLLQSRYFKAYANKGEYSKTKWSFSMLLVFGVIILGITSCKKDDDDLSNSDTADQAWFIAFFNETPNGRVWYMNTYEDLPSNINVSNSVELGLNTGVYSFEGKPYTVNTDAKTITKWNVDDKTLELSVAGIMSYAAVGMNRTGTLIFNSSTSAIMHDFGEGLIVEFNPETMKIRNTLDIEPIVFEEKIAPWSGSWVSHANESNTLFPIQWFPEECCGSIDNINATLAVFNRNSGEVEYKYDNRSISLGNSGGIVTTGDGAMYVTPTREHSFFEKYWNSNSDKFHSILKIDENGNFDDQFEINLKDEISDYQIWADASFVYDNEMAFVYSNDTLPDSWENRYDFFDKPESFQSVTINLDTKEVKPFSAFDEFDGVEPLSVIENTNYFRAWSGESSSILRQNSLNNFESLSTLSNGPIMHFNKLW